MYAIPEVVVDLDDLFVDDPALGVHPADLIGKLLDSYQHRDMLVASTVCDDLLDILQSVNRWYETEWDEGISTGEKVLDT